MVFCIYYGFQFIWDFLCVNACECVYLSFLCFLFGSFHFVLFSVFPFFILCYYFLSKQGRMKDLGRRGVRRSLVELGDRNL